MSSLNPCRVPAILPTPGGVVDTVNAEDVTIPSGLSILARPFAKSKTCNIRTTCIASVVTPVFQHCLIVVPVDTRIPERAEQEGKDGKQITVGTYTRTVSPRFITFACAHCGQTVTQERYPSPKPMYCTSACKKEGEREQTKIARPTLASW